MNPLVIVWAGLAIAVGIGLGAFLYWTGVADGLDKARSIRDDASDRVGGESAGSRWKSS